MVPKVILPPESLPTNIATIRPLIRVCPLVNQQIVTFRKLPVTKFAYELLLGPRRPARGSQQSPVQVSVHLGRSGGKQGPASGKGERGCSAAGTAG